MKFLRFVVVTAVSLAVVVSVVSAAEEPDVTSLIEAAGGNSTEMQILRDAACFLQGSSDCLAEQETSVEGRGKKKKYFIYAVGAAIIAKAAILPFVIGFLKLLTGKALLITKMALLLITIISLKR